MRHYLLLVTFLVGFIFNGWSQNGKFMSGIDLNISQQNVAIDIKGLSKLAIIENGAVFNSLLGQTNSINQRGGSCFSYQAGPYLDLLNPPCDDQCGIPLEAGYQVWENEAYLVTGTAGSQYTFEFCNGYDANNWSAVITVVEYNIFGDYEDAPILGFVEGCSVTFTTPLDAKYIIIVSGFDNCGGGHNQSNNGFVTIDCGPDGATCYACTAGTLVNSGSVELCPGDSIEVGTLNDQLIPTSGGYGWNFSPGTNGSGGPFNGSSFIIGEANPTGNFWGNDLGGTLAGDNQLQGDWLITGFSYDDENDIPGTVCESTSNSLAITFLDSLSPGCVPDSVIIDSSGSFCPTPRNLSVSYDEFGCGFISWEGDSEFYNVYITGQGESIPNTPNQPNTTSPVAFCQGPALLTAWVEAICDPSDLILTGVIDATLPEGLPKAIELYANKDISDLSVYGIGSANNGEGTDGEEFTLSGSAEQGDYIYVSATSEEFITWFGFAPNFVNSVAEINGDDAIELFYNNEVADVFGDINIDGTGEAWEYTNGWAYRINETGPDRDTFILANWFFSGADSILVGDTSDVTCNSPSPFGSFNGGADVETSAAVSVDFGFEVPPNCEVDCGNSCVNAIDLYCGYNHTDSWLVTNSNMIPSTCGPIQEGFWYAITGSGLDWEIVVDNISPYNLKLQLFSGECDNLTCVAEADNDDILDTLSIENPIGLYYLFIGSTTPADTGTYVTFDLDVACRPLNDECDGAFTLRIGGEETCNDGAGYHRTGTIDALQDIDISCESGDSYDLWYKFTANAEAIKFNSITGNPGVEVFDGSCGALGNSIGCLDNETGVISGLTIDQEYYAVVWTETQQNTVEFCLEKFTPESTVENDTCEGAVSVSCGIDVMIDGTAATINGTPRGGCSNSGAGLWFTFEGDGQSWEIMATPQSADIEIQVFEGNCEALTCTDEANNSTSTETLTLPTVSGTTYYMYIGGIDESQTDIDSFNLTIECTPQVCEVPTNLMVDSITSTTAILSWTSGDDETAWDIEIVDITDGGSFTGIPTVSSVMDTFYLVTGLNSSNEYEFYVLADCEFDESDWAGPKAFETLPPPPANDLCINAIQINCTDNINGSTMDATADNSVSFCGTSLGDAPGVWYTFNGNGSEITLSLCGSSFDSKIGVLTGSCNALTCVTGENDDCGINPEVILTTIVGLDYYVYITGNNGAFGDFSLSLSGSDTTIINATSCNPSDTGIVDVLLTNSLGCDSLVTTITTLLPSYSDTIYYASCSLDLVGETVDSNETVNGCDSIIVTVTTLLSELTTTNQLYTCDPSESGTVIDTFVAANGCDSLSISITSLLSEVTFTNELYTCDPNEVNSITDTFVSSNGCDSIVTTNTILLSDVTFTNQLYTCDSSEVGSQEDVYVSSEGCDSTVITITSLSSSLPILNQLYTCDPTELGTEIDTFVAIDGCDSITVTLTSLFPDVSTTNQLFTCDANEVGTIIDTFTATNGCDSLVTTITSLLSDTTFNNQIYTCIISETGEMIDTFTSSGGCDSIVQTITILLPDVTSTIQSYTCDENEVGTSVDTFMAVNGCDSIVVSNVGLLSDETFTNNIFTCEPSEVGSVTDTLMASAGCDSIVVTITSLLSDTSFTNEMFTCDINEVGTTIDTLVSSGGCDSVNITITTLTVGDSVTIQTTSCNPDDIGSESETFTNSIGCDSVVTTITTFGDYLESYTIYTCNQDEEGITIDTFIVEDNCDSIVQVTTIFDGVIANFDYFLVDTTIQFFNYSENADDYFWRFGDGTTSTINNPTNYYDQSGPYGVFLIASNEYCSDTIFKAIQVNLPTGIGLDALIESIVLYPNPNNGTFEVELKSNNYSALLDLTLFDLTGKRIDTRMIDFVNYAIERYSFNELPSGSYFLQIQDGTNRMVLKIEVIK